MFSSSTQDAIKVALSIIIAICLALWFQWEKPYWAAIAVGVMALNESFAHAINKGYNRIIGTLLGAVFAFFLIEMFSQDRLMFFTLFTSLLAISIYMSSDKKYGYIFSMTFTVCSIITCMGQFNGGITFQFTILRLQETLLGVVVYSLVYRLLWPVDTETGFTKIFVECSQQLIDIIQRDYVSALEYQANLDNITRLDQILDMPLTGSYRLRQHRKLWQLRVEELFSIFEYRKSKHSDNATDWKSVVTQLTEFEPKTPSESLLPNGSVIRRDLAKTAWNTEKRTFVQHYHQDYKRVMQGVSMFIVSVLLWIYLPIPGGAIFPMLAGILSSQLPTLPSNTIKDATVSIFGTGTVILLQYVFLMPHFTELWQLALFYFVNTMVIWQVFSTPRLMIHRILSINLLVLLTSGALNLTPVYSIEMPLLMLVSILLLLLIAKLFTDIFNPAATLTR